ncbi:hypothetical protein B0T14DRAFT_83160 [Immersiella caudata]|uniref:Uncharacterized protein n=1 Tax=Immersiella caudata TaxID=314043 RepID=A0AA39XIR3_9PEZI|nr:hypothetical protein B0T14DRAFT_83160 [Immersiella caudata]
MATRSLRSDSVSVPEGRSTDFNPLPGVTLSRDPSTDCQLNPNSSPDGLPLIFLRCHQHPATIPLSSLAKQTHDRPLRHRQTHTPLARRPTARWYDGVAEISPITSPSPPPSLVSTTQTMAMGWPRASSLTPRARPNAEPRLPRRPAPNLTHITPAQSERTGGKRRSPSLRWVARYDAGAPHSQIPIPGGCMPPQRTTRTRAFGTWRSRALVLRLASMGDFAARGRGTVDMGLRS